MVVWMAFKLCPRPWEMKQCREACVNLEEFETAKAALDTALKLGAPESRCKKLIEKCLSELAGRYLILSPILFLFSLTHWRTKTLSYSVHLTAKHTLAEKRVSFAISYSCWDKYLPWKCPGQSLLWISAWHFWSCSFSTSQRDLTACLAFHDSALESSICSKTLGHQDTRPLMKCIQLTSPLQLRCHPPLQHLKLPTHFSATTSMMFTKIRALISMI